MKMKMKMETRRPLLTCYKERTVAMLKTMPVVWRVRLKKPNESKKKPTISLRAESCSSLPGLGIA